MNRCNLMREQHPTEKYLPRANVFFRLFVSGGYTGDGRSSSSVEVLDLKSTTTDWKQCAPMHEERGSHAMIAFNNQLFVFGGRNGSNRLASCEK